MACQVSGEEGEMATDAAKMLQTGLMTDSLLCTLVGWRGWSDPDGNEVKFKLTSKGCVNEYSLGQLSPLDQLELAGHAIGMISVGGSESD